MGPWKVFGRFLQFADCVQSWNPLNFASSSHHVEIEFFGAESWKSKIFLAYSAKRPKRKGSLAKPKLEFLPIRLQYSESNVTWLTFTLSLFSFIGHGCPLRNSRNIFILIIIGLENWDTQNDNFVASCMNWRSLYYWKKSEAESFLQQLHAHWLLMHKKRSV